MRAMADKCTKQILLRSIYAYLDRYVHTVVVKLFDLKVIFMLY